MTSPRVCLFGFFSRVCGAVCLFASANTLLFGRLCISCEIQAFSKSERVAVNDVEDAGVILFISICLFGALSDCLGLQIY